MKTEPHLICSIESRLYIHTVQRSSVCVVDPQGQRGARRQSLRLLTLPEDGLSPRGPPGNERCDSTTRAPAVGARREHGAGQQTAAFEPDD
jgi:hypothetical protein